MRIDHRRWTGAVRPGRSFAAIALCLGLFAAPRAADATPTSILFVGNSYTFGRVDPVLSYNAANVRDLTAASNGGNFTNTTGSNPYEPHPWGGVAGIFKKFTVEAGLDYDVALSTRNAASLRGQYLNSNTANWDMLGNIASQRWDKVVLQDLSDGPLPFGKTSNAVPAYFTAYATKLAEYARTQTSGYSFRERDLFGGTNAACAAMTGASQTSCGTLRTITGNPNANSAAQVYLYETWARPNLINGGFVTNTDPTTGAVTRTTTPITGPYASLEEMTADLRAAYGGLAANNPLFAGVAPAGDAFLLAVQNGVATRNMFASDAATDGKIDLWFDDGTHASKYGSYLAALTLFGRITGLNPQILGASEQAASDLGISQADALTLQYIAAATLIPEPAGLGLLLPGLLFARGRRLRRGRTAGSSQPHSTP